MKPSISFPPNNGVGQKETISSENNIVIIGANGSGKTRLGSWIEKELQNTHTVHRISAQRALNLPEFAPQKSFEQADKALLWGSDQPYASNSRKFLDRWQDKPDTFLLDDFDKLLSNLFAKSQKRDADHTQATKAEKKYIPVPDAPIDIILSLWADIMPQRKLFFDDGKVLAQALSETKYHGKEMSDGERVTLYLIGQCLCVPDGSVIIIDEPEIHLHRSLMSRLWNKIEATCPNKLFVFITHDLEFAASRIGARKIWVRSFDGNSWVWENLPEIDEIPEAITLEIIGNRNGIIFTEGEKGSLDNLIYQAVYPEFHIVPRGGCAKVIESTRAMRASPELHHLSVYGLIDRDYRPQGEIDALLESGILTLDVAEIENLFCIEAVIRIIIKQLNLDEQKTILAVREFILNALKSELMTQITNSAESEIAYQLSKYSKTAHTLEGLSNGIQQLFNAVDVSKIFSTAETRFSQAISTNSIDKILKIYNRKKLPQRVGTVLGLQSGEYPKLVIRALKSEQGKHISSAFRSFLPDIPQNGTRTSEES
jgi:energy-coupling factor transporter ATP-binding protein EcfA2